MRLMKFHLYVMSLIAQRFILLDWKSGFLLVSEGLLTTWSAFWTISLTPNFLLTCCYCDTDHFISKNSLWIAGSSFIMETWFHFMDIVFSHISQNARERVWFTELSPVPLGSLFVFVHLALSYWCLWSPQVSDIPWLSVHGRLIGLVCMGGECRLAGLSRQGANRHLENS